VVLYVEDLETGIVHINKDDFVTYCGKYRGDMKDAELLPGTGKRECNKCRASYGPEIIFGGV